MTSFTEGVIQGSFTVPTTAKDGDIYTVNLVSGDKIIGSDSFIVKIQDNTVYEPVTEPITKDNGVPTTEEEVIGNVTIPDYPTDKGTPVITVDDPSNLPDGTTPGTVEVPVTVTYPEGKL
ncbi:Rib/alpha-like domain-containing protein [Staphylococcus simulans]